MSQTKSKFRDSTFKTSSRILSKIQRYADPLLSEIPQWLNTVIECSCDLKRGTKLLLVSIEAFVSILAYQGEDTNLKAL
jgi:hypothetical protein